MIDRQVSRSGKLNEAAGTDVTAARFRWELKEFDQVEPLELLRVIVVQFVRSIEAEVLVPPGEVTHVRRNLHNRGLQEPVSLVDVLSRALGRRKTVEHPRRLNEMISMPAGDLHRLGLGDRPLVTRTAGHPLAGLPASVEPELQSAATGDAAEDRRELFVILELEPVD
ncbi:hypothetical protein X739_28745 [Mesorhizobium sp. LNHC220B00]|nr:hypothetical protein X739_28745 [Mesorhizobium sp. LNHC220B00]